MNPCYRLAIISAVIAAMLTACGNSVTDSRQLSQTTASFILTNPRAVKLPIHVQLSQPTVGWAYYGDSLNASVDTCGIQQVRATAYDANNRQLADDLVTWQSLAPDTATIDDSGWVRPATCWKDSQGHVVLMHSTVRIVATLKFSK